MNVNSDAVICIPAKTLKIIVSKAQGYKFYRGRYISPSDIAEASCLLYDSGYERYDDEPFPESYKWRY